LPLYPKKSESSVSENPSAHCRERNSESEGDIAAQQVTYTFGTAGAIQHDSVEWHESDVGEQGGERGGVGFDVCHSGQRAMRIPVPWSARRTATRRAGSFVLGAKLWAASTPGKFSKLYSGGHGFQAGNLGLQHINQLLV
jgi:hypothetical protein